MVSLPSLTSIPYGPSRGSLDYDPQILDTLVIHAQSTRTKLCGDLSCKYGKPLTRQLLGDAPLVMYCTLVDATPLHRFQS